MKTTYGPLNWRAQKAAETSLEDLDQQMAITEGKRLWALLGREPHADTFWDVVAPLVHALAAEGSKETGYRDGFSAATACEQLMHEIAIGHHLGERS